MRHRVFLIVALVAAMLATACAAPAPRGGTEDSLVAAENAFARQAGEVGIRAAFLANFADDGMVFEPGPVRLRDAWAARPAPADPRALNLTWAPAIAGIAHTGDLGFTSGPFTLTPANGSRPPQHGVYFSVWRYADQAWKVVLDAGILTPAAVPPAALEPAPRLGPPPPAPGGLAAVQAIERALGRGAEALSRFANDGRLAIDGAPPAIGRDALAQRVAPAQALAMAPGGGGVSAADDLAYTFGTLTRDGRRGYYAHLWTRDAAGAWVLAVAVWYDGAT